MMKQFQHFLRDMTTAINVSLLTLFWNRMTPVNRDRAMTDIIKIKTGEKL